MLRQKPVSRLRRERPRRTRWRLSWIGRSRTLPFGFLGLLRGSPGLCGPFCRLYAAFKLCNLVRKLAIFVFF